MKMAAPYLQESGEQRVLLQSLQRFVNVVGSESGRIVDDTHLDKVIDGLSSCGQGEGVTLRSLLDSSTLNLPSAIARCITHGDARVKSFGIRLFGVYAQTEESFTALLAQLTGASVSRDGHVDTTRPVATLADPSWWHEFLEDGGSSVQYTALGMLKGVSCHPAGWQWLEQGKFVQSAVQLLARSNSFFVKKAATVFLASVLLHSVRLLPGNGVDSESLLQLLSLLKRSLVGTVASERQQSLTDGERQQPLTDDECCTFQAAVSVITAAARLVSCSRPAVPLSVRWLQGVLPSLSPLLEALKTKSEKECWTVLNLFQALDGETVMSLLPASIATQPPSEVVLHCCREILLSTRREGGKSAHGLALPEVNVLITLELLMVFAGNIYPIDLRSQVASEFVGVVVAVMSNTTAGEATVPTEASYVLRGAVPECTQRVLLPVAKSLKCMLQDNQEAICLVKPLPQPLLLQCVTKMAAHYQWTDTDDPPDAGRTNLFQELLAVAGLLLLKHAGDWGVEASTLLSLYNVVERTLTALIPSLTSMQLLSSCLHCLPLILGVCCEAHLLNTAPLCSPDVVSVVALPRLLEACMACEEWEVKDSCTECLRDLYKVLEGGEGGGNNGEGDLLSFLSVHKLVLSAVGDEDHNVRASGLAALSQLASGGGRTSRHLVSGFCAENGISEVQLFELVTELAVSDFSTGVRVAAWKCLTAWHCEHTPQVGVSITRDTAPNQKGPPVFSALSEQQNALNMSKALMVSVSDEDHEVQAHAVRVAEQVLVVALGQVGHGSTCDGGGVQGDVIGRVGSIDFNSFFTRRSWEDIHISVAEQIHCSSENLLQLLSTGCERVLTEDVKAFYTSLQQTLVSTLEAVNSSAAFYEESPVDSLVSTLKEIVSAAEAEDSKFAEADCY